MNRKTRAWLAVATVSCLVSFGCADEREPVNRVQANALKKSFFVGDQLSDPADDPEFYSAATIVDVPYGVNHGLFSGLAGGLKRVKWEVTETTLLARLAYETIQDVDGRGARSTNDGQVVAAFTISKHFDITRAYNTSTGEELNVVEENESDRPWYERKYMRVDWSKNLISSSIWWDPLAQNELFESGYETEQASYAVEDPNHPDAPQFDSEGRYFDVTNKLYVTPKTLEIDGQKLPTCLWNSVWVSSGTSEAGVCESAEIKLRMSFKRVPAPGDPDYTDYEPMFWDGARMDAFGAFYEERKGYDDRYGVVDNKWYRFASRYNIWQKSTSGVACASSADSDRDGTDDECASAGAGSQCNEIRKVCTIPYAQRQVRTLAWHYHLKGDDALLFDQTARATGEWDTALRTAVQAARYVECKRTGAASIQGTEFAAFAGTEGNADEICARVFPIDQRDEAELRAVEARLACQKQAQWDAAACPPEQPNSIAALPPVFVLCHNPVSQDDHPACGAKGLKTRVGDLRYHSVNVWPTQESSSPWGFGPAWADPLSGEVIQASINVYDGVTDIAAQQLVDEARWVNGELTASEISGAAYAQSFSAAEQSSDRLASGMLRLSAPEVDKRLASLRHADPALLKQVQTSLLPERPALAKQLQLALGKARTPTLVASRAEFDARIQAIKDSGLESKLLGPMWAEAAGVDPSQALSGGLLELASPLRGLSAEQLTRVEHSVERRLAEQGMCLYGAPEPGGLPALGKLLKRKFPDASDPNRNERMWNYVRSRMHYGVILHEMGHSVGLRHNFTSSFDSVNYRPQYWQLRTNNGRVTERCTQAVGDGSSCVGPRYFDPLTQDEIDQSIETWAQTSVMDYSGEDSQDWLGLGVYDYAAARAIYADVMDVRQSSMGREQDAALRDLVGNPFQPWVFEGDQALHYSQFSRYFGLLQNCREATPVPPANWDEARDGIWDPVFDGEIVAGQVCDRPPVDYVAWRDLVPDGATRPPLDNAVTPSQGTARRAVDGRGRVRVPYMFNSDEWRDGWTGTTMTRDAGADQYEQFVFWINQYENRHIFDNYRRNRSGFSIVGSYARSLARFHNKLGSLTQGTSIIHDFFVGELAKNSGMSRAELLAAYEGLGGPMREEAIATSLAFDHFMRVLTRPNAGLHYTGVPGFSGVLASGDRVGFSPRDFFRKVLIADGTSLAGNGDITFGGRPLTNAYQDERGYDYYRYVHHVGSFYEKTFAFEAMLNASYLAPAGFNLFDGLDGRWRHTNFVNLYPDGVRRALGAMLTEDWELIAPRAAADDRGLAQTITNAAGQPVPARPMAWVSYVNRAGPELCWPTSGQFHCSALDGTSAGSGDVPARSIAIEPQVGYETQKFALLWAYIYLPASQVLDFPDMLRIYRTGSDVDPGYLPEQRVSWRDPSSGLVYTAKRYGNETLLGKTYDQGVAAKMIQWANTLTAKAYQLDAIEPFDPITGEAKVLLDDFGNPLVAPDDSMTPSDPANLTCDDNRHCQQLRNYRALLDFSRELATVVGFPPPDLGTR